MCWRNIAKTLSGCVFALLFCSCVRYDEVVLPSFTEEKFLVEINQEKSILYITHRESHYNFSLFDSFGIPLSSKALENGKLKSTKFLPSNALYDAIFMESLRALKEGQKELVWVKDSKKIRITRL